jgi:hypothetical protein
MIVVVVVAFVVCSVFCMRVLNTQESFSMRTGTVDGGAFDANPGLL